MMVKFHKVFPIEEKRGTLIVVPQGDAISFRDVDVERELKAVLDLIDRSDDANLVIDLRSAEYFGTVIIGAIVKLGQQAAAKGRQVVLSGISTQMQQVLEVMKLDTLWPHYPTRKQALKALK